MITIRGRKKALIVNREGKNIYPEEVENVIASDPLIADCVVIGYRVGRDPGEHVGVIVHPDEEALTARNCLPRPTSAEAETTESTRHTVCASTTLTTTAARLSWMGIVTSI